jgi:ATP-binding cassette subfamily B protein
VIFLGLLLAGAIAVQLINPQVIRYFLDAAEVGSPLPVLLGAAGLFLAIAVIEQLLGLLTTYLSEDIGWKATNRLREDLALHCLRLDMTFHKTHSPGAMIERIDGDITALNNFFSHLGLNLLNNLLLLAGVLALLWFEDWRLGLAITLIAITGLVMLNVVRRRAEPHWRAVLQANAELYGFLEEQFNGTEDIRTSGATAYAMRRLYELLRHRLDKEYGAVRWLAASLALPIVVLALANVAVFSLGDYLYRFNGMSLGTVYLLFYYVGLLGGPLWQIVNQVQDLQHAGASIGRIQELHSTGSRIQDTGQMALPLGPLRVAFENVSFRYEAGEEVILNNLSFHLEPGQVLGLLGRTGSGKSTLTRLLVRQIDPTAGTVRLGNGQGAAVDIRQVPIPHLRSHVGIVAQEVQLFHATVRDNLTFFDETVSDERLLAVSRELGLAEWLVHLPHGLDTVLGAGGQGLSAGEAQLLAFLRVFLQDPGLVILDEASSRLDPATERLVDRAVQRLLQGRTGIIIAHRLRTIERTDQVMILEQGNIREYGSRVQLAGDPNSRFATLLRVDAAELFDQADRIE